MVVSMSGRQVQAGAIENRSSPMWSTWVLALRPMPVTR
jgi:hypothetical protein